jgi:hypothetical protein
MCAALQGEAGGGPAAAAAAAAAGGRRSSSTPAGIKTAQRWTQEEHDLLLQVNNSPYYAATFQQPCHQQSRQQLTKSIAASKAVCIAR